jgi:molecular chaperone GrpE
VTFPVTAMTDPEPTDTSTPDSEETPADAAGATEATPTAAAPAPGEIEALRKERDELYNRYLRAVADLDNYRRRVVREKDELRQFAVGNLVESLLPVLENLRLALASARQTDNPAAIAEGVAMVAEQFRGALAGVGLTEIQPEVGADFDPHQEESIGHQPSETVPEEKILQVYRSGFALNGRILRPARVVLSSGPAAPDGSTQPAP